MNHVDEKCAYFSRKLNGVSVSRQLLLDEYTPDYIHSRKKYFFDKARELHQKIDKDMVISRWAFDETGFEGGVYFSESDIKFVTEYYDYKKDISTQERSVWYVNFADFLLFGFYDDGKFAQDEIQTLEHPLLCSVVRYLDEKKLPNMETETALSRNKITAPYLVENVPYWISVNTSVKMADGSVHNIYGHCFSTESHEVLNEGVKIIKENINDNIIAVSAPDSYRDDYYSFSELRYIIESLITSFSAAIYRDRAKGISETIIHTGNWGCGALKGNSILSYLCQFIAAGISGVTKLIFHAPILQDFNRALLYFEDFKRNIVNNGPATVKGKICSLRQIIDFLTELKFHW